MHCKNTHYYNILQEKRQKKSRRAFLRDDKCYFVAPPDALVDAVIEAEEGFSAILQAAGDDGGAKQDAAIWAVEDAVAKSYKGMRGFHEEGHLSVKLLAIHYIYMVGSRGNSMVRMLCRVADIFTTNGESAVGGKLSNVVSLQKYFHGTVWVSVFLK